MDTPSFPKSYRNAQETPRADPLGENDFGLARAALARAAARCALRAILGILAPAGPAQYSEFAAGTKCLVQFLGSLSGIPSGGCTIRLARKGLHLSVCLCPAARPTLLYHGVFLRCTFRTFACGVQNGLGSVPNGAELLRTIGPCEGLRMLNYHALFSFPLSCA